MATEKRLIDANALRAVMKSEECDCEVFPWAVDNAPTVDAVEVVHGEWVVCGDGDYVPFMCSHCGKTTAYQYKVMYGKYCPNCGAKMDGGVDRVTPKGD